MSAQIELTKTNFQIIIDKECGDRYYKKVLYVLIVENYTSLYTTKEQLIEIFRQSNVIVIFADELFESFNQTQHLPIGDILYQTEQKLLQAEDKIKKLESELAKQQTKSTSIKNSKQQSKSITDYF